MATIVTSACVPGHTPGALQLKVPRPSGHTPNTSPGEVTIEKGEASEAQLGVAGHSCVVMRVIWQCLSGVGCGLSGFRGTHREG